MHGVPQRATRRRVGFLGALIGALILAIAGPASTSAQVSTVQVWEHISLGPILVDPDGWTLYVWDRDGPDAQASASWPLLVVTDDPIAPPDLPGTLGVITRADGTRQVTYSDRPLYRYVRDTQPGDANGHGAANIWWTVSVEMAMMEPASTVMVSEHATLGSILLTSDGWTLYTFDADMGGVSNCSDDCAQRWPPLSVTAAPMAPVGLPGALGVITRTDGTVQVTYNGWPLYRFFADTQAGEANGHGRTAFGGTWSAASLAAMEMMEGSTTVVIRQDPAVGRILSDPRGMTLYQFDQDQQGRSTCLEASGCALVWAPYTITGDILAPADLSAPLGLIARADGRMQVTYNSWPLYFYIEDTSPGDTRGHQVTDAWGYWSVLDVDRVR